MSWKKVTAGIAYDSGGTWLQKRKHESIVRETFLPIEKLVY